MTIKTKTHGARRRPGAGLRASLLGLGLAILGGAALGACGGDKGTLKVNIVTPPGPDDPFLSATQVRMTLGDNTSTAEVAAGRFSVKIEIDEPSKDSYVRLSVEALDAGGQVVGRGRTPNFVLLPENSEISVFVGRPGRVTPTEVNLQDSAGMPAGRAELSGVTLRGRAVQPAPERGFGAIIAGGVDGAGTVEPSAWLYDPLVHKLVPAGKPMVPRRGAALAPSTDADRGQQAILWGGAPSSGGVEGALPTTAEVFDPNMSSLATVFQAAPMEVVEAGAPGAVGATVAEIKDGAFLASGGRDRRDPMAGPGVPDQPLNQAVLLDRYSAPEGASDRSARPGVRRMPPANNQPGPMAAARFGHSASRVALPEGVGLLLFGGLSDADAALGKPAAELFSQARAEFRALPVVDGEGKPVGSRRGHVAVTLQDGRVLVIGGLGATMMGMTVVEDSGLIIDPKNGQATARPGLLSVPRHGAAATLMGEELVICGGLGGDDKPLASCEFVSVVSAMRSRDASPMPTARAGHLQLVLETDQLLLVGGVGEGGRLPAVIDLFTPIR
jgi:hypothetical protein